MGASQSTNEPQGQGESSQLSTGEMKTDFYELLGVERTADQEEFVGPQFLTFELSD